MCSRSFEPFLCRDKTIFLVSFSLNLRYYKNNSSAIRPFVHKVTFLQSQRSSNIAYHFGHDCCLQPRETPLITRVTFLCSIHQIELFRSPIQLISSFQKIYGSCVSMSYCRDMIFKALLLGELLFSTSYRFQYRAIEQMIREYHACTSKETQDKFLCRQYIYKYTGQPSCKSSTSRVLSNTDY